jgi:hypothetical protein
MAKVPDNTNQGTPLQGDSCAFPFFGNVGVPLMATLNIPRQNVGLPVWFGTIPNVLNALDASQLSTLVLEYNGCSRLTIENIEIFSPNHRPKPPLSTLNLTENHSESKP